MSHQFPFEKLEIWKLSIQFSKYCYQITGTFPESEKYGLINQIRRASSSVSANIAEGSSRSGKKDQARFIQIAYSSLMEVLNFYILAFELEFINENQLLEMRKSVEELSNKLNAYNRYLNR